MRSTILAMFAALALAAAAPAVAQTIPEAVIADPAADPAHPPRSAQVLIPSGGVGINALFYLAGGAGPHPTVLLLHGFPGNEQNLDLAQAIRRAGWNVLTLHYRGSWGSPGQFSIAHAAEDGDAAIAFLRDPAVAAKFGIDTRRIVIGGHSMGGFVTAAHARSDPDLLGAFFIDPWNTGATGAIWRAADPAGKARLELNFDDLGHSLAGADAHSTAVELGAHATDWDIRAWGPGLAHIPVLVIGAERGQGVQSKALADAVAQAGGKVSGGEMSTDHSFSDHRIALSAAVVDWLDGLLK